LFPPVAAGPEPDLVGMYDPVPVALELLLLPYGALPDEATAVDKEDAALDVAEADALLEVEEETFLQERS
jgi:hypothetical protein